MADTRDTLLTGEEFEALNALGASERVGRRKIYFWMWARLYLLVVLLTFRALLAIFFPEQFAISYAFDQEHYYSVALFRLCSFSPMVAAYLYCLNKRIFLSEASLIAAVALGAWIWLDLEMTSLSSPPNWILVAFQMSMRIACLCLAILNHLDARSLAKNRNL